MYRHGKTGHCRCPVGKRLQKISFLSWPCGQLLIGRGSSHVRTINKPLAYMTNVLLIKNGIQFEDYEKDV